MQIPMNKSQDLVDPLMGVWRGVSVRLEDEEEPPATESGLPILFQMNIDYTYLVAVLGNQRSLTFGRWERREENLWVGKSIYMIIPRRVVGDMFLAEGVIKLRLSYDQEDNETLQGCFQRTTEPFAAQGEAVAAPQGEEIEGIITAVRVDLSLSDVPSNFCEIPDQIPSLV